MNFSVGVINDTTYNGQYANSTVCGTRILTFLCPSATAPSWVMASASAPLNVLQAPGNSYFASVGSSLEFASQQTGGPPNGPFSYVGSQGNVCGIQQIRDGTSNTIAFGEWQIGGGSQTKLSIPADIVFLGSMPAGTARNNGTLTMPNPTLVAGFNGWLQQCQQALATSRNSHTSALGEAWAFMLPGVTLGNVLLAPNPRYPNCDSSTVSSGLLDNPGMWGLSSFHPGGANVLMCDGSVRFLKDSTNMQTVWALGSRDQGEVIDANSY
jgi:prepilin-type processing-associated H-X9-DG protein